MATPNSATLRTISQTWSKGSPVFPAPLWPSTRWCGWRQSLYQVPLFRRPHSAGPEWLRPLLSLGLPPGPSGLGLGCGQRRVARHHCGRTLSRRLPLQLFAAMVYLSTVRTDLGLVQAGVLVHSANSQETGSPPAAHHRTSRGTGVRSQRAQRESRRGAGGRFRWGLGEGGF